MSSVEELKEKCEALGGVFEETGSPFTPYRCRLKRPVKASILIIKGENGVEVNIESKDGRRATFYCDSVLLASPELLDDRQYITYCEKVVRDLLFAHDEEKVRKVLIR